MIGGLPFICWYASPYGGSAHTAATERPRR